MDIITDCGDWRKQRDVAGEGDKDLDNRMQPIKRKAKITTFKETSPYAYL